MAFDELDSATRLSVQTDVFAHLQSGFYAQLCKLENLQLAYTHLKEDFANLGIDKPALEVVDRHGVEKFLRQLNADLHARTYHPTPLARQRPTKKSLPGRHSIVLRDQIVQAALKLLLEPALSSTLPCDPEPEQAIKWVASVIDKGFSRVYAMSLNGCWDAGWHDRLLERVSRRIADAEIIGLLKEILAASTLSSYPHQGLLAPVFANIAFEGIDEILQQAKTLGREGNFLHVQGARLANELVILSDNDARFDWLLPAVQKRLREELSKLHYDPASVETQSVDLMRGEPLCFLGFELRSVTGRRGESRVHYQLLVEPSPRLPDSALPSRRRQDRWRHHFLQSMRHRLNGMTRALGWRFVQDAYCQVSSIQVGWRHLPITLYPILMLLFGWCSPIPWLCLASIFVCNWQWTLSFAVWLGGQARQRWPDVVLMACGIGILICLFLLLSD